MASFDPSTDLGQDPAYRLVNSPVSLFHRHDLLALMTEWLARTSYQVVDLDAATWHELKDLHDQLATAFDFPNYYCRNFDALRDCLRDVVEYDYGWDPNAAGLAERGSRLSCSPRSSSRSRGAASRPAAAPSGR
jgi:hypothetical protein